MIRQISRWALPALALILLLGGCAWNNNALSFDDGETFDQKFKARYGWTEERMLRDGWLEARVFQPEPIYCYRTLATPECYRTPQKGEENRLIGYFAPAGK